MEFDPKTLQFKNVTTDAVVSFGVNYYIGQLFGGWMLITLILFGIGGYDAYKNYQTYQEMGGTSLSEGYVHRANFAPRDKCVVVENSSSGTLKVIDVGKRLREDGSSDPRCSTFASEVRNGWQASGERRDVGMGDYVFAGLVTLFMMTGAYLLCRVIAVAIAYAIPPLSIYYKQITLVILIIPFLMWMTAVKSDINPPIFGWAAKVDGRTFVTVNRVFINDDTGEVYTAPENWTNWADNGTMKEERL